MNRPGMGCDADNLSFRLYVIAWKNLCIELEKSLKIESIPGLCNISCFMYTV